MNHVVLVGIGVAIGSVGSRVLFSDTAKKVYVKGLVTGMRVRDGVGAVIEDAKAQFDDMCAEAEYERECEREAEKETTDVEIVEAEDVDEVEGDNEKPAKTSVKTSKASKSAKSTTPKKETSSKK